MKKQTLLTLLTVCACVSLLGTIGFLAKSIYVYSQTMDELNQINYAKSIEVHNTDDFTNETLKYVYRGVTPTTYSNYEAIYDFNGIKFISYSDSWDESDLISLSEELLKNKHGEEINYISRIEVVDGEIEVYSGYKEQTKEEYKIPLCLYNFIPYDTIYTMRSQLSIIRLTGGDTLTTVEDMARTLSHEYGHHYAEYYFGLMNDVTDRKTEYFELRNNSENDIITIRGTWQSYLDNHMWYLAEIAAEDYVYLMGSDTTHNIVEFYDTKEKLKYYATNESKFDQIDYSYKVCRNATPHENPAIDLPNKVEGLAEYYYSFIDEEPPTYTEIEPIGDLNLTAIETGSYNYRIEWDKPYTDKDIIYTLISYDMEDNIYFVVRSVAGDKKAEAYIGKYDYTKGNWIYTFSTNIPEGTELKFRVSITFPDGTVVLSDALEMTY